MTGVSKTLRSCTSGIIRSSEERDPFIVPTKVLSACQTLENSGHLIALEPQEPQSYLLPNYFFALYSIWRSRY